LVRDVGSRVAKRVPNVDTGYSARRCLSTSAHQPVALRTQFRGWPGRRRHHRDPVAPGVHCSVLRKRSSPPPLPGRTGVPLEVELALGATFPRRHVPQPRTRHGFGAILENCIASTSVLKEVAPWSSSPEEDARSVRFQVTKSQRWMPWRQVPMKDVGGCEKPRGAVYQALIRGSPNGETRLG
jgi:hypothetical protein